MRRLLMVINPEARGEPGAAAARVWGLAAGLDWEVAEAVAEVRGHAYLLAQESAGGDFDLVVAVGGDGTVREVAAGLAGGEVPLAFAPAGAGNLSYRELFGTTPWENTLGALLERHRVRRVDLVELERTGELGLQGFSGGWLARAIVAAPGDDGRPPPSFPVTIRADGQLVVNEDISMLAVGGCRCRLAGSALFPGASVDDGLLDLVVSPATDRAGLLGLTAALGRGELQAHPLVTHLQARRIEVVAPTGFQAELDGDAWEREFYEVALGCAAGALPVAVPGGPGQPRSSRK